LIISYIVSGTDLICRYSSCSSFFVIVLIGTTIISNQIRMKFGKTVLQVSIDRVMF